MLSNENFSRLFLFLITEKEKRPKSKILKKNVQFNTADSKFFLLFRNLFYVILNRHFLFIFLIACLIDWLYYIHKTYDMISLLGRTKSRIRLLLRKSEYLICKSMVNVVWPVKISISKLFFWITVVFFTMIFILSSFVTISYTGEFCMQNYLFLKFSHRMKIFDDNLTTLKII